MLKNHADVKDKHELFIKTVCETEIVYALSNEEGFATSSSNDYEDEEGEPVDILCFWSHKALANACATEDWAQYKATELSLADFMEDWCIGIDSDDLLVGTNFDQNLFGYEIEGFDLLFELIAELKKIGKEISFSKFENLADLEAQLKKAME